MKTTKMVSEIKLVPSVSIEPYELKGDEYTVKITDDLGQIEFQTSQWHLKKLQKLLNKIFKI